MLRVLCLTLVCSMAAAVAHAQSVPASSAPTTEYDRLVDDAVREYRERNFPEARSLFARAHTLSPSARTLRGLGMTELELRNYADSVDLLRRALDSQVRPLDGALSSETAGMLERAQSFVGRFVIEATPLPATVLVNDVPTPLREGRSLILTVGDCLVELRAPGFNPEKRELKVRGGEYETLRITWARAEAAQPLTALPAATLPPAPYQPAPAPYQPVPQDSAPRRRLYKNPWLWTGVGVVVAGAAVGLALALRKDATTEAPNVNNPGPVATRKLP